MKHFVVIFALLLAPAALAQNIPCCSLGDVNGSGSVSVADIVELRRHMLDMDCLSEEELCNGDVDGDGLITDNDINLIQELILGVRKTFPRCGDLDGDGQYEWGSNGDDLNFFTGCFFGGGEGCGNADANDDGILGTDDLWTFLDVAEGQIHDFPGCACGEGACAPPQ